MASPAPRTLILVQDPVTRMALPHLTQNDPTTYTVATIHDAIFPDPSFNIITVLPPQHYADPAHRRHLCAFIFFALMGTGSALLLLDRP